MGYSLAAAQSGVRLHLHRAAARVSRSIGFDARYALPRLRQALKQVGRSVGLGPNPGFHPGKYWPILLIAVALAESAHAPLLNGALGAMQTPSSPPSKPQPPLSSAIKNKLHDQLHRPHDPNPSMKRALKKDSGDSLRDLKLLVDPIPFHRIQDDVTLPDPLIDGGGGVTSPGNVIPIINGNITGGGGTAGDGGFSGGGSGSGGDGGRISGVDANGLTAGASGPIYPVIHNDTAVVSVPEPSTVSIILIGIPLLGRRGHRRRI
jgi:hypothetical protein